MPKDKAKQIKEIMQIIDEIPVASASQIIQEKGLLFRLRRNWLKSVAETIYPLIDTAEQRGREEVLSILLAKGHGGGNWRRGES